jgi:NAD(P)H-dependent FMN reductase
MNRNLPNILAISGSPNKNSTTSAALRYALTGAASYGAVIRMLELSEYKLPSVGSGDDPEGLGDLIRLKNELSKADGFIIGTPEFHNSISGILKYTLDLLDREQFENKVAGIIGVAGGDMGAVNSLNNLMIICRSLHCWVSPYGVSIAKAGEVFDKQKNITDKKIENRLSRLGFTTAKFADIIGNHNADSYLYNYTRIQVTQ